IPPLAADDDPFRVLGVPPNADRLELARGFEASCELLEGLVGEEFSRLLRIRHDPVKLHVTGLTVPGPPVLGACRRDDLSRDRLALWPHEPHAQALAHVPAKPLGELVRSTHDATAFRISWGMARFSKWRNSGGLDLAAGTLRRISSAIVITSFAPPLFGRWKWMGVRSAIASLKSFFSGKTASNTYDP